MSRFRLVCLSLTAIFALAYVAALFLYVSAEIGLWGD